MKGKAGRKRRRRGEERERKKEREEMKKKSLAGKNYLTQWDRQREGER